MKTVIEAQTTVRSQLDKVVVKVNLALKGGKRLALLRNTLGRLGRGEQLPHWYDPLFRNGTLPNLDGKSLGSVLEMMFVAVIEKDFLQNSGLVPLRINPARGVDIPDLKLGIKSPSENYCTSEPFFSAYERITGNEHDCIILLTDYQTQKKKPPLRVQIIKYRYLRGSQIADKNLCLTARKFRELLTHNSEPDLKKVVRFLAYINQSDYKAKMLLALLNGKKEDNSLDKAIEVQYKKLTKKLTKNKKRDNDLIYHDCFVVLDQIRQITPRLNGIINASDNWVIEVQKDFGRYPNENEWERFLRSPLDGVIGMSYALQWRYNFGSLFKDKRS